MISRYYTESVAILAESTSTAWGNEPAWGSGTTITAAMNPVSGQERFASGRPTPYATWKMFCSDTVSITDRNRVVYSGDSFDVVFVKDTLDKGHHKLVYLVDVARG